MIVLVRSKFIEKPWFGNHTFDVIVTVCALKSFLSIVFLRVIKILVFWRD